MKNKLVSKIDLILPKSVKKEPGPEDVHPLVREWGKLVSDLRTKYEAAEIRQIVDDHEQRLEKYRMEKEDEDSGD